MGGIHGDEYGTDVARTLVKWLSGNRGAVPSGSRIDVIECLNPDGRVLDTRGNANGVDLNRNMPASTWTAELDPRDSSYSRHCGSGSSPGSEPESAAFIRVLEGGRYRNVTMLHSSGGIVDFDGPGGEELASRMSGLCGLPVEHLSYQPYIHGSVGQYVPEKFGIPVITLELKSRQLSEKLRKALLATLD